MPMQKGSIVKVTVIKSNGGERWGSPDFKKSAGVSKHYSDEKPRAGVPWWCRVVFDSDEKSELTGKIYLWPIRPLKNADEARPSAAQLAAPRKATLHLPAAPAKRAKVTRIIKKAQSVKSKKNKVQRAEPVESNKRWLVDEETVFSQVRFRITCQEKVGEVVSVTNEVTVNSLDDLRASSNMPKDIREQVATRLRQIDAAERLAGEKRRAEQRRAEQLAAVTTARLARQAEEKRLRDEKLSAKQQKLNVQEAQRQLRQKLIGELVGATDVTVVAIFAEEQRVTLVQPRNDHASVYVNGEIAGIYGDQRSSLRWRSEFPFTMKTLHLKLSSGETLVVHSHDLKLFDRPNGMVLRPGRSFSETCKAALVDKPELKWKEAEKLRIGSVLGHEYRFQWVGDFLTEGTVWFPRQRPLGGVAWRDLPVKSIPEESYPRYLKGLEGIRLAELLAYHAKATAPKETSGPKLSPRQQGVYKLCTGKMWTGNDDCKDVTLGPTGDIIYHVVRQGKPKLYLLDSARVRAIVLFREDQYGDAVEFAEGTRKRREAWGEYPRIIHNPGWEQVLEQVLSDPAKEAAFFAEVES
jgi:hypothetical protein